MVLVIILYFLLFFVRVSLHIMPSFLLIFVNLFPPEYLAEIHFCHFGTILHTLLLRYLD